jgi:hypothetical protein
MNDATMTGAPSLERTTGAGGRTAAAVWLCPYVVGSQD